MPVQTTAGASSFRALLVLAGLAVVVGVWLFSRPAPLGPVDGHDLPGEDTARVRIGDLAPDFRLPAFDGEAVTLSSFRGEKEVVLVFYRGHW